MVFTRTIIVAVALFVGVSTIGNAEVVENGDSAEAMAWANLYAGQLHRRNRQTHCDDLRCSKYVERLRGLIPGTQKECVLNISKSMDKKSGLDVVYLLTLISPDTPIMDTVAVLIGNSGQPYETATLQEYKVRGETLEIGYRTLNTTSRLNNVKINLIRDTEGEVLSVTSDFIYQGVQKTTACGSFH